MDDVSSFLQNALRRSNDHDEIELRTTMCETGFSKLLSNLKQRYDLTEEVYESQIQGHTRCQMHADKSVQCVEKRVKQAKKFTHEGVIWKIVHATEQPIAPEPMMGVVICRRINRWKVVHSSWGIMLSKVGQSTHNFNQLGCSTSHGCGEMRKYEVELELIGRVPDMRALSYLLDFISLLV